VVSRFSTIVVATPAVAVITPWFSIHLRLVLRIAMGVRALSSVGFQQSAESGFGAGGGVRTAIFLLVIVIVVAVLAIFTKTSVGDKPAILAATPYNPVEATPKGLWAPQESWGQRWAGVVLANEDASKDPIVTNSGVAVTTKQSALRSSDTSAEIRLASLPTSPASQFRAILPRETTFGLASFYGHDTKTASGEKFDARAMTAAHRTLPFGTRVRVTDIATGRSVMVRINDRGPYIGGRIIDVSTAAAESLGIVGRGVAKVRVDVIE